MRLHEALESYFGGFIDLLESYSDLETASVKVELEKSLDDIIFQSMETDMDDNDFVDSSDDALQVFEAYSERLLRVVDGVYLPVNLSIKRSSYFMHGMKVKPVFRALVSTLSQFIKLLYVKIDEMRVGLGFEEMSSSSTTGVTANALPTSSSGSSLAGMDGKEGQASSATGNAIAPVAATDKFTAARKWNEKLRDSGKIEFTYMYMFVFSYFNLYPLFSFCCDV